MPHLSDQLSRLRVDMVGLSETMRPGSAVTSSKVLTYYWSGRSNGHHVKGVVIGISSRLQPSVVEVTPVDEHIMQLRLKHSLGFMSVIAVYYGPTEVCERRSCSMPNSTLYWTSVPVVMHSLSWATLMLSLALKGLVVKYVLVSMVLVPGMTTPALHHWTWYSNAERDRPYPCQYSLEDPPELQGFSETRVLCDRSQACFCYTQASCQVQKASKM